MPLEPQHSARTPAVPTHHRAWGKIITIGLVLYAIVFIGAWILLRAHNPSASLNTTAELLSKNQAYQQGTALTTADKPEQAKDAYTAALAQTSDAHEQGIIKLQLATSLARSGDKQGAIALDQEIAVNPSYWKLTRARAVTDMAALYHYDGDPSVTTAIFDKSPFAELFVTGDVSLSYRHLFEMASALYPTAASEMRIAEWYTSKLTYTAKPLKDSTKRSYLAIVRQNLANTDTDIARMRANENTSPTNVPEALEREAKIVGALATIGEDDLAHAESLYKQSIDSYGLIGGYKDGYARFHYAVFLQSTGKGRNADIISVLAPLTTNAGYKDSNTFSFFAAEKDNLLKSKKSLVQLASIDPDFKKLLISLGWSTTDFTS